MKIQIPEGKIQNLNIQTLLHKLEVFVAVPFRESHDPSRIVRVENFQAQKFRKVACLFNHGYDLKLNRWKLFVYSQILQIQTDDRILYF